MVFTVIVMTVSMLKICVSARFLLVVLMSLAFCSYAQPDGQLLWHPTDSTFRFQDYLRKSKINHLDPKLDIKIDFYIKEYFKRFVFNGEIELHHFTNLRFQPAPQKNRGKFPAIVYAPGYRGLPFENSILCERLAASGFIVLAIEGLGVNFTTDSSGLEFQAKAIATAVEYLRSRPDVDAGAISLVGFSWGSLSAILTAMRDSSILSVISLDGSIHYLYDLAHRMPDFNPSKFNTPVLLFSSLLPEIESGFFHDLPNMQVGWVRMENFQHTDFMSYQFLPTIYQNKGKNQSYLNIVNTVRQFLIDPKVALATLKRQDSPNILTKLG